MNNNIPRNWFNVIIYKSGRPHLTAISLLAYFTFISECIFVKDNKFFIEDVYAIPFKYDLLAKELGISKGKLRSAYRKLFDLNLLGMVYKVMDTKSKVGMVKEIKESNPNNPYCYHAEINVKELKKITY